MRKPLCIIFVDANPEVRAAIARTIDAKQTLQNLNVEFRIVSSIHDIEADAYVSPANSFGWMDGGIDAAYRAIWQDAPTIVQDAISAEQPFRELLVGDALTVAVDNGRRYLIVAPTMRLPRTRVTQEAAMLATRAAIRQAWSNYSIGAVMLPGMGTGSGGLSPAEGAAAMLHGIYLAIGSSPSHPASEHWSRRIAIRDEAFSPHTPAM